MMSPGQQLRDEGIRRVSRGNVEFLKWARSVAREIAYRRGRVTTDDLRVYADAYGIEPSHPNVWGAIFRVPGWRHVGWAPSRRPSAHARYVRVWALEDAPAGGSARSGSALAADRFGG